MNGIKENNKAKNSNLSQRDLLLIILFALGAILIVTSFLNWITVSVHNSQIDEISSILSTKNPDQNQKRELVIKLDYHQTRFDNALSFPKVFFIIAIIFELVLIIQIFKEYTLVPKESSMDDHERFKMKGVLLIITISFVNVIYLLLRFYIFQIFFVRLLFYVISLGLLFFAFLVLFVPSFIDPFLPRKAPTLDEFEKLTSQFENFSSEKPNNNSKKET